MSATDRHPSCRRGRRLKGEHSSARWCAFFGQEVSPSQCIVCEHRVEPGEQDISSHPLLVERHYIPPTKEEKEYWSSLGLVPRGQEKHV